MGLLQDRPQSTHRNQRLFRNDDHVCLIVEHPSKLNVAASLSGLAKSRQFQPPFDFTERQRIKPPQLPPQPSES